MKSSILIAGVVLCVVAAIALAYQGFTFTHREKLFDLGPLHATTEKRESVPVSPLLGIVALAGGIALIVAGARKSA